MKIITVCDDSIEKVYHALNSILKKVGLEEDSKIKNLSELKQLNQVIAIDGSTLALVMENP